MRKTEDYNRLVLTHISNKKNMKKIFALIFLVTLIVLTACQGNQTPQPEASAIDKQIYNQAIESDNSELCKTIENSGLKKDCKDAIEGNGIAAKAIKENDLKQCDSIKNSQIKESCQIQVNKNLEEIAAAEKAKKQLEEEKAKMQSIQDDLDIDACYKIETEHLKKECIINVATAIAEKTKDAEPCKAIDDESLRERCELNGK